LYNLVAIAVEVLEEDRQARAQKAGHGVKGGGQHRGGKSAPTGNGTGSQKAKPPLSVAMSLWGGDDCWGTYLVAAMHAQFILERDVHYLVNDGEVQILDPATGRVRPATRWPDKMHQVRSPVCNGG
jgi:SecA preprotein cross-linking domain